MQITWYSCQVAVDIKFSQAAFNLVKSSSYPDIPTFMKEYYLDCPAALQRIEEGKPITVKDDQGTRDCVAILHFLSIANMILI